MASRTFYEILMLHPSATPEVIGSVYRQLAKQYHPDQASGGDAQKMAEINEAHAILSDPEKRARYDELTLPKSATTPPQESATYTQRARQSAPGATNLKYEEGAWSVRDPSEPTPAATEYGEAGEPPPYPAARGSVLSFGRYRGWSIWQVAAQDRDYLEWLQRTMAGRTYATELEQVLKQV